MIQLKDLCQKASSNIAQKDLEGHEGQYPIYGASGLIGYVDFYKQENPYVAVVKDGAGIGRVMCLPEKSSVIGTMQYILPNEGVNVHYLAFAMEHMNLAKYFSGATIPHIYFKDYGKEKLLERTEKEQKSIAEILSKMDSLISLRKQQIAKLDELVKARFVEMFGDFEFNPKEFPVYHLCELCDVGSSKRIYQEEQSISGIPFLKVADLNELIDTGKYSCSTFIPLERYEQLLHKELTPTENDILITSRGTLGKCYIVQSEDEFYFQDGMISWLSNLSPKVSSIYISYLFAQPYIQKQIESLQAGSTVAYLSIAMLKKMNVILPPKKLQDGFATFVEHVDQQKQTVQQSLEKLELMKKALMQEYFG